MFGDTGAASVAVQGVIDDLRADGTIPPAVSVELGGVLQQQAEAFGGLFAAMGVAILLVYLMMVLAFNSLTTPFIILFSLPLATIGAFPALLLTDRPIGLSALIGFSSLAFGAISDRHGRVASFYVAAGMLALALVLIGVLLPADPTPREGPSGGEPD